MIDIESTYHALLDNLRTGSDQGIARLLEQIPNLVREKEPDIGWTLLHLAARDNHGAGVKLLLRLGADVNEIDMWAMTPLHYAAQTASVKVAKLLIAAGAAIEALSSHGTPLEISSHRGRTEFAHALLQA